MIISQFLKDNIFHHKEEMLYLYIKGREMPLK
jgi:hypothetical protein